jgi:hypothetical protein
MRLVGLSNLRRSGRDGAFALGRFAARDFGSNGMKRGKPRFG